MKTFLILILGFYVSGLGMVVVFKWGGCLWMAGMWWLERGRAGVALKIIPVSRFLTMSRMMILR